MNVNLPKPDVDQLLEILKEIPSKLEDEQNRLKHSELFSDHINIARCEYCSSVKLKIYTNRYYQHLFYENITPVIVKLINTDINAGPAFYMPHVDKKRLVTLNFCISPGGKNVTTSFYKESGDYSASGNSLTYNDVTLDTKHSFNDSKWYFLDVNRYHSVENISDTRILFSISFNNISGDEFKEKYKNLLSCY